MKRPMEQQWQAFSIAVLPPGCSETQRIEMRKAFMAGAFSVLTLIMSQSDTTQEEPTDDDMALMDQIMMELTHEMRTASGLPSKMPGQN